MAGLARSSYYYRQVSAESEENQQLMRRIDRLYLKRPFFGSPRMTLWLQEQGYAVNEKRVARLMRVMGIQAIVPGPHTSHPHPGHRIYPYLLRNLEVSAPNLVWCSDITYIPMRQGYLYLAVVMDWFSRYVLEWELSSSLESSFCLAVLTRALEQGIPAIFNTDQGAQFTSEEFTGQLKAAGTMISMDGRGRALDNVFVERLWRSLKYEEVYIQDYADGQAARKGLMRYFGFYNRERRHQALAWRTPEAVFRFRP
jgi:putative transposase